MTAPAQTEQTLSKEEREAMIAVLDSLGKTLRHADHVDTLGDWVRAYEATVSHLEAEVARLTAAIGDTCLCPHCESSEMRGQRVCLDCGMVESWYPSTSRSPIPEGRTDGN